MKIVSVFFAMIFSAFAAWSQCTPDTNITHGEIGIYPDSATGLPHAITNMPYNTVIQVKVGTDTLVSVTPPVSAHIVSIDITNVLGLPTGFSYTCNPSNCSFPGGSDACINITGLPPSASMMGPYPLVVELTVHATIIGIPQTQTVNDSDYTLYIDSTTGIATIERNNFSVGQNQPNPAKFTTNIPVTLMHADQLSLTISNLIGEKIITGTYDFQRGRNLIPVDLHGVQEGIYIYTISNGRNSITKRMIISYN